jgi:hypothetical protein
VGCKERKDCKRYKNTRGNKLNPYVIIGTLKKSLEKRKEELQECKTIIKELKRELDWEKSRKF